MRLAPHELPRSMLKSIFAVRGRRLVMLCDPAV
jgi:hypothetical protein